MLVKCEKTFSELMTTGGSPLFKAANGPHQLELLSFSKWGKNNAICVVTSKGRCGAAQLAQCISENPTLAEKLLDSDGRMQFEFPYKCTITLLEGEIKDVSPSVSAPTVVKKTITSVQWDALSATKKLLWTVDPLDATKYNEK